MARLKKEFDIQSEKKPEVSMTDAQTLESVQTEIDKATLELEKVKKEIEEQRHSIGKTLCEESEKESQTSDSAAPTSRRAALKDKIERQRAYDSVLVTGKFMNLRAPGKSEKLPYVKYESDQAKWWDFEHGKVYTIPRGFADQINDYYHTPKFSQKQGGIENADRPGSQIAAVDTSNKKYAFVPINF